MAKPDFWNNEKRYYDLKSFWRNQFGCRVYKLQIDAGFTCPNRDGTVSTGGCIYCDGRGSRLRQAGPLPSVAEQIRTGKAHYREHRQAAKFIAYFQTFTNTYGPYEKLKALYDEALAEEDVIGLSIGTRPDCVSDEVIHLLGTMPASAMSGWNSVSSPPTTRRCVFSTGVTTWNPLPMPCSRAAGEGITYLRPYHRGPARRDPCGHAKDGGVHSRPAGPGDQDSFLLALEGTALGKLYKEGGIAMMDGRSTSPPYAISWKCCRRRW